VLYLIIGVLAVRAVLVAAPMVVRRDRGLRELDRFHAARRLTTSWSRGPLADGPAGKV
jgi:hypothetical protein